MQVDTLNPPDAVWWPDRSTLENANLTRFMRALGVDGFEALNERASADPAWFHDELIRFLDYRFQRRYEQVLDLSEGLPFAHWCVGSTTNVVLNCIDRRRDTARYTQPALVWEGEDGTVTTWTFADLDRETSRLGWGLRRLGLGRGDVVGMYLPNLPQAAAAMLAVAKIGGIVLPMFSGFGADAVAQRLNDGQATALITVDGSLRRGKTVGAKVVADEALQHCPGVRHVVVLSHLATEHGWTEGRDHWWHELAAGAPDDCTAVPTEAMPADDPFLLMFTSGTSGKPKGVVHTHCGFPIKTALDMSICMDLKPEDRFLWMSDMGWLVGPIRCSVACSSAPRSCWQKVRQTTRNRTACGVSSSVTASPTWASRPQWRGCRCRWRKRRLPNSTCRLCASSSPPVNPGRPRPGSGLSSASAGEGFRCSIIPAEPRWAAF